MHWLIYLSKFSATGRLPKPRNALATSQVTQDKTDCISDPQEGAPPPPSFLFLTLNMIPSLSRLCNQPWGQQAQCHETHCHKQVPQDRAIDCFDSRHVSQQGRKQSKSCLPMILASICATFAGSDQLLNTPHSTLCEALFEKKVLNCMQLQNWRRIFQPPFWLSPQRAHTIISRPWRSNVLPRPGRGAVNSCVPCRLSCSCTVQTSH